MLDSILNDDNISLTHARLAWNLGLATVLSLIGGCLNYEYLLTCYDNEGNVLITRHWYSLFIYGTIWHSSVIWATLRFTDLFLLHDEPRMTHPSTLSLSLYYFYNSKNTPKYAY